MVKYAASTSKAAKGRVQQEVVQTMKDMGGRFLKHGPSGGITEEMDDAEARSKVGQALRYRMKHGPLQEKSSLKSSKKGQQSELDNSSTVKCRGSSYEEKTPPVAVGRPPEVGHPNPNHLAQLEHLLALKAAAALPQGPVSDPNELLLGLLAQGRPAAARLLAGNPYDLGYRSHLVPGLLPHQVHQQPLYPEVGRIASHLQANALAALLEQQRFPELGVAPQSLDLAGLSAGSNKRLRLDSSVRGPITDTSASYEPPSRREEEDVALLLTSMAKNS